MSLDYAAFEQQLWPHGPDRDAWMIVDAAADRHIRFNLINSNLEVSCLYSGNISDELEAVAPYLVQLVHDDQETRTLVTRGWGKSWGVFLRCGAQMNRLRRHLRTFLMVNDYRGKRLLFRYYDPRVLRVYLPTCTSDELTTVYGPVTRFWTESDTGQDLLSFEFSRGGRLIQTSTSVTVQTILADQ